MVLKGDREKLLFTQLGNAVDRFEYMRREFTGRDMKALRQIQLVKGEVRRIADTIEVERLFGHI